MFVSTSARRGCPARRRHSWRGDFPRRRLALARRRTKIFFSLLSPRHPRRRPRGDDGRRVGGGTRDRAACTRASSSLHSNARRPATDERDDHPARDQGWRDGRDASSQRAPRGRLRPRRADPDVRRGGSRHAHERRCVRFGTRRFRFPHPPVSPVSRLSSSSPPRPRLPSPRRSRLPPPPPPPRSPRADFRSVPRAPPATQPW